jgi:hypothetical protein
MFKQAIRGLATLPKYLSSDHDPLYRFHQWEATLRILGSCERGQFFGFCELLPLKIQ